MLLGGLRQYEQNLRAATETPAFRKALKEGKELQFGYSLMNSKFGRGAKLEIPKFAKLEKSFVKKALSLPVKARQIFCKKIKQGVLNDNT